MRADKLILSLLFTCCILYNATAQRILNFENFSSGHGLSQLSCYALAQDANGFLWVGTQDGLNRYDGRQFKVYAQQNTVGRNLPSNAVFALYFDQVNNLLWTGTSGGLCLYNPAGDSLAAFSDFFPFAAAIEKLPVKRIVSFARHEYWIIAFNNGLYYLNTATKTLQRFFTDPESRSGVTDITMHEGRIIVSLLFTLYELIPHNREYAPKLLIKDYSFPQIETITSYDHALWVGTISEGCYQVYSGNKKNTIAKAGTIAGGIYCFATDANNDLWIGTRGNGIYRYDATTKSVSRSMHDQFLSTSPASNFVVYLLRDRQGNMWCGLSGGLSKYDPLSHQFTHINGPASLKGSLMDNVIYSIYRTRSGTVFVGTQNRGLFEWNTATNEFIAFPATAMIGKANNVIYDMVEDDQGNIWAATLGGLMQLERQTKKITYYPANNKPSKLNNMYALTKLKKADSLLVSADDGLHFFSLTQKRWMSFPPTARNTAVINGFAAFRGVRHFYEDEQNILWLCAPGSGLIRFSYRENKLETVDSVNMVAPSVRHLLADGSVFLLATDNGLVVYDHKKNKVIRQINVNAEGVSNVCYAIQKDSQGFYWVSTNSGLRKINAQFDIVQVYTTSNGLTFSEYNTGCCSKDEKGRLYFGGMGGITFFNPATLTANKFSPKPIITAFTVNEVRPIIPAQRHEEINLSHRENFLSFQFAVTNFSNEKNNRFSYRLKGLNDNWSQPVTSDKVGFTSLPPGAYVFELKAVNSDGYWSEEVATMSFTILRPWWQTWWFLLILLFFITAIVAWAVRKRILFIKRGAQLKQQIAEAEMMAMRAQMNPHFVFNSLNSIREMILSNENETASHFLGKFAGLIRITLEQSEKSFITLRQIINHLTRYIEIEQIRNGEFTSRILAEDELDLDDVILPSMLIQPFVENALWHGTAPGRKNININIDFKKHNGQLLCIIEDDGVGIRQSLKSKANGSKTHHSLGIENVSNRIRLLNEKYQLKSSILIMDKSEMENYEGSGTVVRLFLPLQTNEL